LALARFFFDDNEDEDERYTGGEDVEEEEDDEGGFDWSTESTGVSATASSVASVWGSDLSSTSSCCSFSSLPSTSASVNAGLLA
jgi:hypothetical protein